MNHLPQKMMMSSAPTILKAKIHPSMNPLTPIHRLPSPEIQPWVNPMLLTYYHQHRLGTKSARQPVERLIELHGSVEGCFEVARAGNCSTSLLRLRHHL